MDSIQQVTSDASEHGLRTIVETQYAIVCLLSLLFVATDILTHSLRASPDERVDSPYKWLQAWLVRVVDFDVIGQSVTVLLFKVFDGWVSFQIRVRDDHNLRVSIVYYVL